MRAQHSDGLGCRSRIAGRGGHTQLVDVVDEATHRRTGRARDVLLGNVEQRGDGVEVAVGLRTRGTAPLAGRQPAALQARTLPCLPQRERGSPP